MSDLRDAARQALEALEYKGNIYHMDCPSEAAITALKTALEQPEQRYVSLPDGLAKSDAEFWLSKRAEIIEACRAQGLTIVTTVHGVHLMRLGEIEAQTAALEQPEQEPVAWMFQHDETGRINFVVNYGMMAADEFIKVNPRYTLIGSLFTHPPRREWRGLTEEEIEAEMPYCHNEFDLAEFKDFARAIEAAPKEKNHD